MSREGFYLAGPIAHVDDGGHTWRDHVTTEYDDMVWNNPLDKYDVMADKIAIVEQDDDPLPQGYDEKITVADLVEGDKEMIAGSEGLLVGWQKVPTCGTPMEIGFARELGLPVAVWLDPLDAETIPEEDKSNTSPWLRYHSDIVHWELENAVNSLEELTRDND